MQMFCYVLSVSQYLTTGVSTVLQWNFDFRTLVENWTDCDRGFSIPPGGSASHQTQPTQQTGILWNLSSMRKGVILLGLFNGDWKMACNLTSKQDTRNIFIPQKKCAFPFSTCKKKIRCDDALTSMTSSEKYTKRLSLKTMEGTKEQFRFYTFTGLKLGDKPKKIHDDLQAVYGVNCVPYSTMYKWIQAFQAEDSNINPGLGPARLFPARNEQNIAIVERLVAKDPHSTIRELSKASGVSVGTIHSILHEDLHMWKLAAQWVPHLLGEDQKKTASRMFASVVEWLWTKWSKTVVWYSHWWWNMALILWHPQQALRQDVGGYWSDRPVVLRQGFHSRKRLFFHFFLIHKELWQSIFCLRRQQSMQHTTQELCCPKLSKKCATSAQPLAPQEPCFCMTMQLPTKPKSPPPFYLTEESRFWTTTPYSPDLAPCDFLLFPILKERLASQKFDRVQDLAKAVKSQLDATPIEDYQGALFTWRRRLEKCVQVKGEYFKGMWR